ncbi:hypothetical protein Dda_5502 [Drechslerella dactyloides]|uniref:Nucleolar protein Dnt1-like N-terminal domain-containing protein n=1 Tax=Drechslerella dactyloides TaxID=74499 RepID=A0AAD6IWB5_DREDA|nr:hypothetical protein Dda_5502 [Drechslerella dactyloides]
MDPSRVPSIHCRSRSTSRHAPPGAAARPSLIDRLSDNEIQRSDADRDLERPLTTRTDHLVRAVNVVGQPARNPKGKAAGAPLAQFLEITPPTLSLEDLTQRICDKYAKLYPRNRPLNIQRLQDSEGNDLDLNYIVGDVFDDKSSNRETSIVRVIHKDVLRDDSVPPESGLRPASSKKRPLHALETVNEDEEGSLVDGREGEEQEGEDEEEIGVPVTAHRSKRQRLAVKPSGGAPELDVVEAEDEDEILVTSSNVAEPSRSRQHTFSSDVYVAESTSGRASVRSPSLGPEPTSDAPPHGDLMPLDGGTLQVPGVEERGSSLIPETSQGLVELLSPKSESFSSPLLPATAVVNPPPLTSRGAARRTLAQRRSNGTLKRPNKPPIKKTSPRSSNQIYELVDTEESSEEVEEEEDAPAPPPKKGKATVRQSPKKLLGPASRRAPTRRSAGSSSTPVAEVPSSQTDSSSGTRISSDFIVEIPHIQDIIGRDRPSLTPVRQVEESPRTRRRTNETPTTLSPSTSSRTPPKGNSNSTAGRKGSKQPETPPSKQPPTRPPVSSKRDVISSAGGSITPQPVSETGDKHDGKGAGAMPPSALRNPEKKNLEAKKSVSFANEGSPEVVIVSSSATATSTNAVKKPRTTFKVPVPVIPPEQQGIGDRSTAEARKAYNAFVGKPPRNRSTSSTPPISSLTNGPVAGPRVRGRAPSRSTESPEKEPFGPMPDAPPVKAGKPAKPSVSPIVDSSSGDEEMDDAPPLPVSPSRSGTSASESEESSSDDEEEEEEEEEATPNKKPTDSPAQKSTQESSSSQEESEEEVEVESEVEPDPQLLPAISDSEDEDYEEKQPRAMTREESPVKGPLKRQLRSLSPEKKDFIRISYDTAPSKLAIEPVSELATPADATTDSGNEEEEQSETPFSSSRQRISYAGKRPPGTRAAIAPQTLVSDSDSEESEEQDEAQSEDESSTSKVAAPSSSVSMIPESPIVRQKVTAAPVEESDSDETSTSTTTSQADSESADEDDDNEESSGSDEEEQQGPLLPPPTKKDKAFNALFSSQQRSPAIASSQQPKLPNGNTPTPSVSRYSKTPEPAADRPRLPHSRMNRNTLGYISPSPGPPSSMPARLPSTIPMKEAKKRHSLSTHYKGLSTLSQQGIPETRDGGRAAPTPTAAPTSSAAAKGATAVTAGGVGIGSQKQKPMSASMKAFHNMLSSQKGGADSDSDSDESSDSSGSEDSGDEKGKGKEEASEVKPKSKGLGFRSFLPFI